MDELVFYKTGPVLLKFSILCYGELDQTDHIASVLKLQFLTLSLRENVPDKTVNFVYVPYVLLFLYIYS